MLSQIFLKNFAIIKQLVLDLDHGFNVITGETGAGKSIVIDALSLCLGERADQNIISAGADFTEITVVFDIEKLPAAREWLLENGFQDDECILRRIFQKEGRSRAFINGTPAPISQLKPLGNLLVDIHGQHEHQSLLKTAQQRLILDRFGEHEELAREVTALYQRWQQQLNILHGMQQSAEERELQIALLQHQLEELENLDYRTGELEKLESELRVLANGSQLLEAGRNLVDMMDGDHEHAVLNSLHHYQHELSSLLRMDDQLQTVGELVEQGLIQLQEANSLLRHYVDAIDLDPQRLGEMEQRIAAIHHLARKHRVHEDELPPLLERIQQELDDLQNSEHNKEQLQAHIAKLQTAYEEKAALLSKRRKKVARNLSDKISHAMQNLGMNGGRFQVELSPCDPGPQGMEKITFLVSANPGQPLAPMHKVASGGELSRISLAIQVSISHLTSIPTLVYDEVDVGIGGAVAEVVGRQLRQISRGKQVISVTHLPQVAALGDQHYQVAKSVVNDQTETRMVKLGQPEREQEIARMLGGIEITPQSLAHAREMIQAAKNEETQ